MCLDYFLGTQIQIGNRVLQLLKLKKQLLALIIITNYY